MAANNNLDTAPPQPLRSWLGRHWPALVVPVGLWLLLRTYHTAPFAHQRARFTLGTVAGVRRNEAGSRQVSFRFAVRGAAYDGTTAYPAPTSPHDLGPRCLVEYDSLDPAQNVGHFAVAIPDSIRRAPANGWRVPPFPVPAWLFDQGRR